jgi:hypothetical protein
MFRNKSHVLCEQLAWLSGTSSLAPNRSGRSQARWLSAVSQIRGCQARGGTASTEPRANSYDDATPFHECDEVSRWKRARAVSATAGGLERALCTMRITFNSHCNFIDMRTLSRRPYRSCQVFPDNFHVSDR